MKYFVFFGAVPLFSLNKIYDYLVTCRQALNSHITWW